MASEAPDDPIFAGPSAPMAVRMLFTWRGTCAYRGRGGTHSLFRLGRRFICGDYSRLARSS
jgi:hypothetical protein